MYLMYLDDSGSPANKSERHFVLAGIIVHDTKLVWVNQGIENLAKAIDPEHPFDIEFHASEIYSRRKNIWKTFTKTRATETIKDVLRIVPKESQDGRLCVVGCVIDKHCFPGQDPVELAFEDLCSRFDMFLSRKHRETKEYTSGLIIFDKSASETSLQNLALDFRRVGTRWKVTKALHEVPLFVDSRASRGIQLADHVAYSIFRRYEHGDINYFNIIQGHLDAHGGKIHGLAHKTYDKECTCPSCLPKNFNT